jgi:hypothetical protein
MLYTRLGAAAARQFAADVAAEASGTSGGFSRFGGADHFTLLPYDS